MNATPGSGTGEPIGADRAREQSEAVSPMHTPAVTARYRDELQVMLHALFADFLKAQEPRLHDVLASARALDAHEGALLIKALQSIGIRFQLSAIAEQIAETRKLRLVEAAGGADAVVGSFHRTLARAAGRGCTDADVAAALADLQVVPTIASHPTEAKRVTILESHRRIYRTLVELEADGVTPRERERLIVRLKNAIALLWMTGELRLEWPTLDEELSWCLHLFNETLFSETQEAGERLTDAVRRHFPNAGAATPAFLTYHTWIGGDCEGNPDVTAETIRHALQRYRDNAIQHHAAQFDRLVETLSISDQVSPPDETFLGRLDACLQATGQAASIRRRNPHEPFRQFCVACAMRLRQTAGRRDSDEGQAVPYGTPGELIDDVRALEQGLRAIGASGVADSDVAPLGHLIDSVGFRTAALDIRAHAGAIERAAAALVSGAQPSDDDAADEQRRTVALFELLAEPRPDPDALGTLLLSGTSSSDDVMHVVRLAEALTATEGLPPIVPLFETLESVSAAPAILDELLSDPQGRSTLADRSGVVEIMLGYAECNRECGQLSSVWALHKAQSALLTVSRRHRVPLRFVHGRGGALSRGRAPTGRAIAAQPAGTVSGRLRVVEQGEAVSANYANPGTAGTHLELLGAGVLAHTLGATPGALVQQGEPWMDEVMETLSQDSRSAYRELITMPGFQDYFQSASPVREFSSLRVGSPATAPGARTGASAPSSVEWVFAWSQNRHLLTGWYGLGSALDRRIADGGLEPLRSMFATLKVFRLVINEVEKTLHQTDLAIAARYAGLVQDASVRDRVFEAIRTEHELTVRHLLAITGQIDIAERFPGFRHRIADAAPLIDRCNAWQVGLLKSHRADPGQSWTRTPLLLSMHCIATGLGWAG